jgi:hypothetical protein
VFSRLVLALVLLLAGCGDLPRPFQGQPGATAMRLAQPPPSRLAVVAPPDALLGQAPARLFIDELTAGLLALEVPATAEPVQKGDWQLTARAERTGASVVASFTVLDPTGKQRGATEGRPVPEAAWSRADPATMRQAAADAVPAIADLLTRIQAAEQQADPNSLFNRPARVRIAPVDGAPGDGNQALTVQIARELGKLGQQVQTGAEGVDFTVQGHVRAVPIAGGMQRIEIQWVVSDPKGERGRVVQLNEIPAGTLNQYWGDVAAVVAREAAGGVRDVILTQSGRR